MSTVIKFGNSKYFFPFQGLIKHLMTAVPYKSVRLCFDGTFSETKCSPRLCLENILRSFAVNDLSKLSEFVNGSGIFGNDGSV